ncbi:MAG TPA: hypothetical protein VGM22_06120 [Methylomirabilota bacterium]|jgi:hypothetical protein
MSSRSALTLCVIAAALAVALTGCATRIRNVPVRPLSTQTNGVVERDHRECEEAITGKLKGVWFPAEVEFASCMIARNYQVYVQLLDASVEVKKASARTKTPPARIVNDLVTCERAASRNLTWTERIARPMVTVAGAFFWPVSVGSMLASATLAVNREHDYADCMRPLGYVVTPWQSRDGDPSVKPGGAQPSSP